MLLIRYLPSWWRDHPVLVGAVTVISVLMALVGSPGLFGDFFWWFESKERLWWLLVVCGLVILLGVVCLPAVSVFVYEQTQKKKASALEKIAAELRRVPLSGEFTSDIDAATAAGRLLVDAVNVGLFDGEASNVHKIIEMALNRELRYQLGQSSMGASVPGPTWHAFTACTRLLKRRQGCEHKSFSRQEVVDGCDAIADMIEQKARTLRRPELGWAP